MIEEHTLTLPSGLVTRVLESGTGTPLVLLHGNPDSADEFHALMTELRGAYRSLAVDLPGYGHSPEPPDSFQWSVAEQTGFLDEVLDALNVTEPVILVVHDVGAIMGLPWADHHVDRVRGVIVTNTVAFEGFRWFSTARAWGDSSTVGRLRADLMMRTLGAFGGAVFRRAFSRQFPELPSAEVDRFVRGFAQNPSARATALRQFREMMTPEFFDGFDAMNQRLSGSRPVRVLWGDNDPFIDTRWVDAFGSETVTILPGVGHWVPLMAPSALAGEIHALAVDTSN